MRIQEVTTVPSGIDDIAIAEDSPSLLMFLGTYQDGVKVRVFDENGVHSLSQTLSVSFQYISGVGMLGASGSKVLKFNQNGSIEVIFDAAPAILTDIGFDSTKGITYSAIKAGRPPSLYAQSGEVLFQGQPYGGVSIVEGDWIFHNNKLTNWKTGVSYGRQGTPGNSGLSQVDFHAGPLENLRLSYPTDMALEGTSGNLIISDTLNNRVVRVLPSVGRFETIIGNAFNPQPVNVAFDSRDSGIRNPTGVACWKGVIYVSENSLNTSSQGGVNAPARIYALVSVEAALGVDQGGFVAVDSRPINTGGVVPTVSVF